jgi:hypothetical protein
VHGAPIHSHRLLVAGSCPRVPVTSNRVGAVGWAKSLACRNRRTQHQWRFCPRGKQSRGHGARDFACAKYLEGRAFAHPTIRAERAAGRRRQEQSHALVVERQTQRFQKPSSQDMGVQVSPSAPVAPVAEWQTRRSQKPLSFGTCRFESCSGHQFAGVAETQDAGRLNRPASQMHVGWTPTSRTNSRAPSSEEERCSYKAEVEIS